MKRIKKLVWIVLFCLLVPYFRKTEAYAAETIDTGRMCEMSMQVPSAYRGKVKNREISVRIYRVAGIRAESMTGLETLAFEGITPGVTASKLEQKAKETASFLQVEKWEEVPVTAPYREFVLTGGEASVSDIETGMYLVCMKPFEQGKEKYQALPYLIFFPTPVTLSDESGNQQQEWNYDLIVDLKLGMIPTDTTKGSDPEEEKTEEPEPEVFSVKEPEPGIFQVYKTGDETPLTFLVGITVVLGGVFLAVCAAERKKRKRTKKEMPRSVLLIFRRITGALFAAALLLTTGVLLQYHRMDAQNEEICDTVLDGERKLTFETNDMSGEEQKVTLPVIDFKKLRTINENVVGWIHACGGKISYPVVASGDDHYLTHALDGSVSRSGTIFADTEREMPFEEGEAVLYGHNMKNGSMFHELTAYRKDGTYLEQEPYVYIITDNALYVYEITSVYVKEAEEFSVEPKDDGKSRITLVTCEYSGKNTRLIVEAVQIDLFRMAAPVTPAAQATPAAPATPAASAGVRYVRRDR